NAPAMPAPTIKTSSCSVKTLSRCGSPVCRTRIAGAWWWFQPRSSPHQSRFEVSYFGQFSQAENTGVPGFEQSFLKRCTTIKVWLEIKQAFGGNAARSSERGNRSHAVLGQLGCQSR